MKIAHVLWSLKTGGMENMVVDISSCQAETEDVALFVINDVIEQYMLDKLSKKVKLFLIKRHPGSKNVFPLIKLNYLIKRFNPDVIHHHADNTLSCIKVCKKVPKVRTIHDLLSSPHECASFLKLYAISEAVEKYMDGFGLKSITIWNGIRMNCINSKKTNPFSDNKLHFVQIGSLEKEIKGQDIVIDAIEKLKKNGIKNIQMHFIGKGESLNDLKSQVNRLDLNDMIVFEGRIPQQYLYDKLANYDLLIVASRSEGFGLTLAEAMAAKVPVLCSDLDATMEVIDNGRLGQYFKSGDSSDLAEKIKQFIHEGKNMNQISEAYKFTIKKYDVMITAKRYIEEYNKI